MIRSNVFTCTYEKEKQREGCVGIEEESCMGVEGRVMEEE